MKDKILREKFVDSGFVEKHVMNSLLDEDVAARDTINELLDDEHETGQKFVLFPNSHT